MKKALILGTSHSVALCKTDENQAWLDSYLLKGRWHDYLQTEYGYEVTNISGGGVDPTMQLAALTMYLSNNPNELFDLAILEGRATEPNVNIPDVYKEYGMNYFQLNKETKTLVNTDIIKHDVDYSYSVNKFGSIAYSPLQSDATSNKALQQTTSKFVHTVPHSLIVHGINRAILSLLETRAKVVKMWKFASVVDYASIEGKWETYFFKELSSKWQLFHDEQRQLHGLSIKDPALLCACRHLNEEGHKYVWQNHIKPALEELNL